MRRAAPRGHWWVLAGILTALSAALFLATVVLRGGGDAGIAQDRGPDDLVPEAVAHGGPVLDTRTATPAALAVRPGTVALTFDDGPDPT